MTYRVLPHVHHQTVNGEVVILDSRTEEYLGLNATASVVWNALASGSSETGAVKELTSRFEIDDDDAVGDVRELVSSLVERGLIEPNPS